MSVIEKSTKLMADAVFTIDFLRETVAAKNAEIEQLKQNIKRKDLEIAQLQDALDACKIPGVAI